MGWHIDGRTCMCFGWCSRVNYIFGGLGLQQDVNGIGIEGTLEAGLLILPISPK